MVGLSGNTLDCNDADADSYPGAAEVFGEQDNNCNGVVDEGVKNSSYSDQDGDGFGDEVIQGCEPGEGRDRRRRGLRRRR